MFVLTGCRDFCCAVPGSCKNFWWTPDDRYNAATQTKARSLTKLKGYDLAFRITFVALLVAEIAGFVLLALGCKTPPPFHSLIGLYVCVGALFVFPIALAIINCSRESYCEESGIIADKTHIKDSPATSDDDD